MKFYLLGICLSIISFVSAQSCNLTLEGTVRDFHNDQPLDHAEIRLKNFDIVQHSDANGYFKIEGLCPSSYTIEVMHDACFTLVQDLNLENDTEVEWYLEHHIIELENVEIQGNLHRTTNTQPEVHMHEEDIERYGSASLGEVLKTQSGINALQSGNSIMKPMIHGMHSSRVLMMNRGVRQEDMEWGVEHAPNMDLNAFDEIRILKGASAIRYGGDAIGGVIIAETPRLPKVDTLQGKITGTGILNGRGLGTSFNLRKGFDSPLAFQIQGSYKLHGDLKAPDYYLNNSGSKQLAFSGKVKYGDYKQNISLDYSYFTTQLGILKASHLGNLNDLANAINADEPNVQDPFSHVIDKPYQQVTHHLAKLNYEKRFRNLGKWEVQYAFQLNNRKEYDVRLGEVTDIPSMDVELTTHNISTHLMLDKYDIFSIETGIEYSFQDNYADPYTQVKRLIPDYTKHNAGIYGSISSDMGYDWKLHAGLRYDFMLLNTKKYYYKNYWSEMGYDTDYTDHIIGDFGNQWLTDFELDYHNISTTVGASYHPNHNTEYALNYAFANRAPNPAELFSEGLHHSAVSIELGDVRLDPENAHKVSFNYKNSIHFLEGLHINIMGYYNYIQDYIYQIPTGAQYTIRGAYPVWQFRQIDATIKGVDVNIDLRLLANVKYGAQLSYTHGTDNTQNLPLLMMPPWDWKQTIEWNPDRKFQPFIAFNTQLVGKQNRVPDYNFSLNVLENGEEVTKVVDISSAPDAYFLIGLNAGFEIPLHTNKLKVQTKIDNLANVRYRNYLNRFRYYADELGRQIQLQIIYTF